MIPAENRKGQATVEASGTLLLLVILIACVHRLFVTAVEEFHSLKNTYYLTRASRDASFVNHSWHQADREGPVSAGTLMKEAALAKIRLEANRDALWDAADDMRSMQEAERG